MSSTRLAAISTFTAATVLLAASLLYGRITGAADPRAMDAMSVDMDPAGNTATSLGPWDECIVASPGDTVTIDITATDIPAAYPMLAFAYTLNFQAGAITVQSADASFLLASLPGNSIFDISEPLPDGDGVWVAAAADFGTTYPSGSGVLHRLTLSISADALAGFYPLMLTFAAHIDPFNEPHPPNATNNAFIAIGTTCDNLPTPTPTPTPMPTPPPAPNDDFVDVVVIGGLPFWDAVSTTATSTEPGEPSPCGSMGATVWYAFTPSDDTYLYAHTDGSNFDTVLAAYTGESIAGLTLLDCNDDAGFGADSALEFTAPAGQTTWFQVGGAGGAAGTLDFILEVLVPAPTPSPTPSPTPPHPFQFLVGDVDCSGAVNFVDALKIVRFEVGLAVAQVEPCPDIGASSLGDVDCDSFTNPRDALAIVRYVAALPALSSQPGCPPIGGEPTNGEPYPVPEGGTPTPGPNGYTVSVTSANVGAGGEVTVLLRLSAPQAGASAYSIDILYDSSLVTATSCENLQPIVAACNPAFAPNSVRVAAASPSGPNGEDDLVSITFRAGNVVGVSGLVPQVSMMLDPDGNPRSTTAIPGAITVQVAAPTPTLPAPTPSPTPMGGFAVGIESATVEPGGTVTVALNAEAVRPGIGAFTVDVVYDDSRLDFAGCGSLPPGACAKTATGNVRLVGVSALGITGSVVLGTITFHAGAEEGVALLDVTIVTLTDPEGRDLSVIPVDGAITIATPSPTPTPAPSPTPTATPNPMPAPTATPTPTPAPPVEVDVEIDETGTVGRGGEATIRGSLECSVPSFVDLTVEVRQRGGKARTEGAAEVSLWCDGHEHWKAKVEPEDGEFSPGKVTVSVHADAHIGGQTGEDDETERVVLKSKHHKERDCDWDRKASPGGRRCREVAG